MINIAKLLKNCPKGTKLYSPLFGEVKFKYINNGIFGIVVEDSEECCRSFDKYGRYFNKYNNAECLLFPSKDCRTWEGWKPPVEPKFKVGDSLQSGSHWARIRRIDTEKQWYVCDFDNVIPFEEQDSWSLVPNSKPHYDISNFYAGMPVLVRWYNTGRWRYSLYSFYEEDSINKFDTVKGSFTQCIPFNEDTKHLLGTTYMCPEEYINW